jgi:AcrR family transcriptional regulator
MPIAASVPARGIAIGGTVVNALPKNHKESKENRERRDRRQDILDAALTCFNERGIEATSIDTIRVYADASTGSIYHHFGDKLGIAAALYMSLLEEYQAHAHAVLLHARTAEEGVRAVVYAYVDWAAANKEKTRFLLYNRAVATHHMQVDVQTNLQADVQIDAQAATPRRFLNTALAWFEPHIASGDLKALPRECYPSLMIGAAQDYARLWLSGRVKTSIRTQREVLADAAWNALRP